MSLLKRNWGLDWGCIIGEAFCGVLFLVKKDVLKKWYDGNLVLVLGFFSYFSYFSTSNRGFFKERLNPYEKGYFWREVVIKNVGNTKIKIGLGFEI